MRLSFLLGIFGAGSYPMVHSFWVGPTPTVPAETRRPPRGVVGVFLAAASSSSPSIETLSIRDIKTELETLGVGFDDCFDKESLVQRLRDARDGTVATGPAEPTPQEEETTTSSSTVAADAESSTSQSTTTAGSSSSSSSTSRQSTTSPPPDDDDDDDDAEALLTELRGMRVKELRAELASRNLRWAGMLEKEDLVQAVWRARRNAADFSVTGLVTPGQVATLTGEEVQREVDGDDSTTTPESPLVVDAYAVWCGPCQMMGPQLEAAAAEWGDDVRVVKFDTDRYPEQATRFRVQGLPTLLLFQGGREIARMEGALIKDQLMQWVQSELDKAK